MKDWFKDIRLIENSMSYSALFWDFYNSRWIEVEWTASIFIENQASTQGKQENY